MPQVRSCGVLCLRRVEEGIAVLLLRHPQRYDLPKGHQKAGESDLQTALRELAEETGITSQHVTLLPDFVYQTTYQTPYKRFNGAMVEKTVVIFAGWVSGEVVVQPHEHGQYEWIAWNPPHQLQSETIDPLLAALKAYLP